MRRVKGVPANPKRHQMRPVLIGPCCTLVSMKGLRYQLFSTLHTLNTRSGTRSRVAHRAPRTRSHHRSLCCTTTRVGPEGVCLGHSLTLFGGYGHQRWFWWYSYTSWATRSSDRVAPASRSHRISTACVRREPSISILPTSTDVNPSITYRSVRSYQLPIRSLLHSQLLQFGPKMYDPVIPRTQSVIRDPRS